MYDTIIKALVSTWLSDWDFYGNSVIPVDLFSLQRHIQQQQWDPGCNQLHKFASTFNVQQYWTAHHRLYLGISTSNNHNETTIQTSMTSLTECTTIDKKLWCNHNWIAGEHCTHVLPRLSSQASRKIRKATLCKNPAPSCYQACNVSSTHWACFIHFSPQQIQ